MGPARVAAPAGPEGAFEDLDAVGARMTVPWFREARQVDHLGDHHPGVWVAPVSGSLIRAAALRWAMAFECRTRESH